MGEDITVVNALFTMVQRIEDKLDDVKDELSTVKSKQAVIETTLQDHISNTEPKSQMDIAKGLILKWIIPIALALLMIGRASVGWIGNGASTSSQYKAPSTHTQMVNDDTFVARNERFDSLLQSQLKKSVGIGAKP